MESFYGGKQGASVVIKAHFKYITSEWEYKSNKTVFFDEYYGVAYNDILRQYPDTNSQEHKDAVAALNAETMVECLKNPNYKDVWYNEYCIIDHPNKNNKNNGKLYRRTLKKANDPNTVGGVAEYIGQIVGPAGSAPQLAAAFSVANLQASLATLTSSLGPSDVLVYPDEYGNLVTYDPNSTNLPMGLKDFGTDINYIPGNNTTAYINSTITAADGNHYIQHGGYGWYNLRKGTDDEDLSLIYLGFDIPYHIVEFESGNTLHYDENVTVSPTINTITAVSAPYYEKYSISVPRGISGAWITNFRQVKTTSTNQYYSLNIVSYNKQTDIYNIPEEAGKARNTIGEWVWLVDFHWINIHGIDSETGNEITVEEIIPNLNIGSYKTIDSIELDEEGHLLVNYTDLSYSEEYPQLTWIKSAEVDNEDTLKITMNHEVPIPGSVDQTTRTPVSTNLRVITSVTASPNGTLDFNRSDGTTLTLTEALTYITSATVTNNHLQINFNNNKINNIDTNLNRFLSGNFDEQEGKLTLTFSGSGNSTTTTSVEGIIRTVQEGLYVSSKDYHLTITNAAATESQIVTEINSYFNGLPVADKPDERRAQVVALTIGGEEQSAVVYYNTKASGSKWQILGTTAGGGSGSGTGAVLDPNNTGLSAGAKALVLTTTTPTTVGTLSDPWDVQSVSVNV